MEKRAKPRKQEVTWRPASFLERRPWVVVQTGRTAYYVASVISSTLAAPVIRAYGHGRRYSSVALAVCEAKDLNDRHEGLF